MEETYPSDSLKNKSNEELMRLAQQDVKGAYDIIYERLYGKFVDGEFVGGKFVNLAYKILKNRTDAEDAAQRALIKGYIKRSQLSFLFNTKFNKKAKAETWLTRILINEAIDMMKRNGGIRKPKSGETEEDAQDPEGAKTGEFLDPDIDKKAAEGNYQTEKETKLMLMYLDECIEQLPEEERIILELREIHEIPYKEIVKISNERFGHSSLGNIKNKTDTAKKLLKKCIENKLSSIKLFLKNKY